jgi:hypothetical protein
MLWKVFPALFDAQEQTVLMDRVLTTLASIRAERAIHLKVVVAQEQGKPSLYVIVTNKNQVI